MNACVGDERKDGDPLSGVTNAAVLHGGARALSRLSLLSMKLCMSQAHAQLHVKPEFNRAAHPDRTPPTKPPTVDRNKKSPSSMKPEYNRAAGNSPEVKPVTVDRNRKSPQSIKEDFKRAADPPLRPSGGDGKGGGGGGKGEGNGTSPPPGPKPVPPRGPK
jgi:hypothetical protein